MKPLIGISGSIMLSSEIGFDSRFASVLPAFNSSPRDYTEAIEAAGGIPVVVPLTLDEDTLSDTLDRLDGLLLTGGDDVDPLRYGEDHHHRIEKTNPIRDEFDLTLARMALDRNMPILGICRGCQIINVAEGGTLYQDISAQVKDSLLHPLVGIAPKWHKAHLVALDAESKLAKIYKTQDLWTNGFHHQAVKDVAPTLKAVGKTSDGVVEAVESPAHTFVVGVQWHPEMMLEKHKDVLPLFEAFVQAAQGK